MIDESVLRGIAILSGAILLLTAADLIAGITTLGGLSFVDIGASLSDFMISIRPFLTGISLITPEMAESVVALTGMILALTAANIVNGIASFLGLGDNGFSSFGSQLGKLGTDLKTFVTNLGEFDKSKVTTVTCACDAIKALAEAASKLPNDGGIWGRIVGENSIGAFGSQLGDLGKDLSTFVTNLGEFGEGQISTVRSAISAIRALSDLANSDLESAQKNLPDFGSSLGDFASDISDFCINMPPIDSLTTAKSNIDTILVVINSLAGKDASVISTFSSKLKSLGTDGVNSFVNAFTSNTSLSTIKGAGIKMVDKVIEGIDGKKSDLKTSAKNAASSGVAGVNEKKSDFKTAGKNLGDGLIEGINAKVTEVYNAAFALGQAAVKGEKDGQASNSPSKLTILAGKWLGEGLIIGMEKMFRSVNSAGEDLGSGATNSISSAIKNVGRMLDSDMDIQPTIRPVLDLSDVSSGAGLINGMFDLSPSIGLMSNVGAINSMMSNRGQNGNGDVVSAIEDLKDVIGNSSGDTYNFGDIIADDGDTAVTDAIKTIVRAARLERRA